MLRHLEVTEPRFNRWRAQYGVMKADEAKRLKTLEAENERLKKVVAEQALNIDMLKELASGRMKVKRGVALLKRPWPGRHPRSAPELAILPDRNLAKVATHAQPNATSFHFVLLLITGDVESERRAHDNDGLLEAHPGWSQGRPRKLSSSKLIPTLRGLPARVF